MIDVALLSVMRRWHFREGLGIRAIARRTGLSRNTVKKYLAEGMLEPQYPRRMSPSKLDAFAKRLTAWLEGEQSKGRKQRRSLKHLHRDLVQLGFGGSYDRVCAFARAWRQQERERLKQAARGTFVPLVFAPGEAFQFDWSEEWAVIAGARTRLQVAQFKLCHSRAFVLRAYPLQTHEMLFDAHNHAFRMLGGVARRGLYDNMKTAVDRVKRGKQRAINSRFSALLGHYLFEAEFCNPAAGWEKGQVEKNVRDSRHRLWHDAPAFASLEALNQWLEERCLALWSTIPHPAQPGRRIVEVWAEERPQLLAITRPFDGFVEETKRVSPTCLVSFERNRYSVPAPYANRRISLRVYAHRLVMVCENQVIAEHERLVTRAHLTARTIYDWRHYLPVVARKPGALRNGAPFTELPEAFKQLQRVLHQRPGGDREMVEILALVLRHDEQAVITAVELALEDGAPGKPHVLNVLHRLLEATPPAPICPPPALRLQVEPEANPGRYDRLRPLDEEHCHAR